MKLELKATHATDWVATQYEVHELHCGPSHERNL